MDIKEVLSNIDSDVLSEDSKSQICDVFEKVVSEKVEFEVESRLSEAVEAKLVEQDEAHASQLKQLLVAIDEDHSAKLKKLVTSLDEDHTAKLDEIVEKYENLLSTEAKALTESLQTDISNFLDLTLDDLLPKDMLSEAVNNTRATEKLRKIQELVSVDEAFIDNHVREALMDGKEQIEALRGELNEALKENVKLGAEKNKIGSELVLERKSSSLPEGKKLFLEQTFKGKSASYINENFDYALQMFERREQDAMEAERSQLINESVANMVDVPAETTVIEESSTDIDPNMSEYVSGLQ